MPNIFISYSRVDKAKVGSIASDVKVLGHDVWFDNDLTGGQNWWDQIIENIQKSDIFILVLSQAALDSYPCRNEYEYADSLDKIILPVLVTNDISINLLPPALGKIQLIDYQKSDKNSALALLKALSGFTVFKKLPHPLPLIPLAPISNLGELLSIIESQSNLSFRQQSDYLFTIKNYLSQSNVVTKDASVLLEKFRNRFDIEDKIADELDRIILHLERKINITKPIKKLIKDEPIEIEKTNWKKYSLLATTSLLILSLGVYAFNLYSFQQIQKKIVQKLLSNKDNYDETIVNRFFDNHDGTIIDKQTNLIWKKCSLGLSGNNCDRGMVDKYTWYEIVEMYPSPRYKDQNGWRLPTKKELISLIYCSNGPPIEYAVNCKDKYLNEQGEGYNLPEVLINHNHPTIFEKVFPNTHEKYWSFLIPLKDISVQHANEENFKAALIDFNTGSYNVSVEESNLMSIRLVKD